MLGWRVLTLVLMLRFRPNRAVTRSDSGAAAVEAALLVTFVLVPLIFGSLEVGRLLWVKTQLTNAAREGAAYAQYQPSRAVGDGDTCAPPNSVEFRARAELGSVPVQVDGNTGTPAQDPILVTTERWNGSSWVVVTGCAATAIASGTRVRVTTQGQLKPLTGLFPALQVKGYQEVVVL